MMETAICKGLKHWDPHVQVFRFLTVNLRQSLDLATITDLEGLPWLLPVCSRRRPGRRHAASAEGSENVVEKSSRS